MHLNWLAAGARPLRTGPGAERGGSLLSPPFSNRALGLRKSRSSSREGLHTAWILCSQLRAGASVAVVPAAWGSWPFEWEAGRGPSASALLCRRLYQRAGVCSNQLGRRGGHRQGCLLLLSHAASTEVVRSAACLGSRRCCVEAPRAALALASCHCCTCSLGVTNQAAPAQQLAASPAPLSEMRAGLPGNRSTCREPGGPAASVRAGGSAWREGQGVGSTIVWVLPAALACVHEMHPEGDRQDPSFNPLCPALLSWSQRDGRSSPVLCS